MKPICELIRLEEDETHGTLGVLKVQKEVFSFTLEPPDRLNERNRSSIPAQQYECRRISSPRFGETFEVTGVPGRTAILFHAGNAVSDTAGCILLGESVGKLRTDQRGILNSGTTFKRFIAAMTGHDRFHLTIREAY